MTDIKTLQLEELTVDNPIFQSYGISYVKRTQGETTVKIAIPIKSTGVADVIDNFSRKRPIPPLKGIIVKPNDPAYKELGLSRKQHVQTYNYADSKYQEELEKHNSELGLRIVLMGLGIDIKDKKGKVIEEEEDKIQALKDMGMTGDQFTQIVNDITKLTKWEVDKEADFLD